MKPENGKKAIHRYDGYILISHYSGNNDNLCTHVSLGYFVFQL